MAVAGNIYPGNTGYLLIGLTKYDVKILKATKEQLEEETNADIRLVQFDKRKNQLIKDICGLVKEETDSGKIYFKGIFNIGFANMEIKIWNIAKEKRKDENSAIMFMVGSLEIEEIKQFRKNNIVTKNTTKKYEEVVTDTLFKSQPTITHFEANNNNDLGIDFNTNLGGKYEEDEDDENYGF
jgi:hypothetical protein